MSLADRCPIVDFDHNSQAHAEDPVDSYRRLRETTPVAWSEANGGYWILADYASLFDAARDDDLFSSQRSESGGEGLAVVIPKTPAHFHIPIEFDPPASRKYRKIMNLITSPAATERLGAMIEHYTTWFIDQYIEVGECDFTDVIGVPAIVTIDWLGLPTKEWKRFASAHQALLVAEPGGEQYRQMVEVDLPFISRQIEETIADRRREPKDDAISFLVSQAIDGVTLTDFEVFSMVDLLLAGGTTTTSALVSQSLVWLYQHPEVRERLISEPSMLERAIEEFLRCFSPTQALARTVSRDTEFHGCPMRAGDRALLSWASANRDAAQFENPDELDIERWPNRHTAFGIGTHRCAGSHIGRAMAHEMLHQILERMPDYSVDVAQLQRLPLQGVNMGYRKIPAKFTPGPRRLTERE
jgi:cytochrome P450